MNIHTNKKKEVRLIRLSLLLAGIFIMSYLSKTCFAGEAKTTYRSNGTYIISYDQGEQSSQDSMTWSYNSYSEDEDAYAGKVGTEKDQNRFSGKYTDSYFSQ